MAMIRRMFVVLFAVSFSAVSLLAQDIPELFIAAPDQNLEVMSSPLGEESQAVILNEAALEANIVSVTLGGISNLAVRESIEVRRNHQSTGSVSHWIVGGASARSTVTKYNGITVATLYDGDGRRFYLPPGYGQAREIFEIDPTSVKVSRRWDDAITPPRRGDAMTNTVLPQVGETAVMEIRVMEFYTPRARDFVGGDAQIQAVIQHAVDSENSALLNNGYTLGRYTLAHTELRDVPETESDNSGTLVALASDPAVDALRHNGQIRADLVGMFVSTASGIAFMPLDYYHPDAGFHIVNVLGAQIDFEFEHEIGHNLNAQHDRAHATAPSSDWLAFGYHNGVHADMESYVGIRAPYYSSATGSWQGMPMGTPTDDNMLAIANAFPYVSQYLTDGSCVELPTALCLLPVDGSVTGRFRVTVDWASTVAAGQGNRVPLTSDTGSFWFFGPSNLEVFVKIVDGRGFNNHFWVYASGLTNVEVTITITDVVTGRTWTRHSPYGTALPPFQDIEAFTP
jgi:hypothetical protein